MTQTITARRLYTDIGSIEFPVLDIAPDGTIADIYSDPKSLHTETTTLTAAFLDIHTHGAVGHDVMQQDAAGLARMQRFLASRGTAHYLPTTVTASIDDTLRALESLANAIEQHTPSEPWALSPGPCAIPIGIHLEGPFLSHAKRGVHPTALLQPPSIDLFDRFQTAARNHIKLLTLAPEPNAASAFRYPEPSTPPAASRYPEPSTRPTASRYPEPSTPPTASRYPEPLGSGLSSQAEEGLQPLGYALRGTGTEPSLDLLRHATSQGVRVSLGHSNATAAETLAAIAAGATSATHTFNAMRPLDHREPGILGTALTDDRLCAELICDGIHVAPALVRLWFKAKGPDRAILVTDAMSATGMPDGIYELAGLPVLVANGRAVLRDHPETLAGSVLTMDTAVSNLQRFTQASLADATRLASHNPAAMLGQPELTRLAPGSPANLNRFNADGKLIATYLRGISVS